MGTLRRYVTISSPETLCNCYSVGCRHRVCNVWREQQRTPTDADLEVALLLLPAREALQQVRDADEALRHGESSQPEGGAGAAALRAVGAAARGFVLLGLGDRPSLETECPGYDRWQ